jgi:hypothetical protein
MEGNMAWLEIFEGLSLSSGSGSALRQRSAKECSSGPKGPPSAPPTIPPIIINPYTYHMPDPAIDPRRAPLGPPIMPPPRPAMSLLPA